MNVINDMGEEIILCLERLLHVPELSLRLFSLMSLIDQGHDDLLSKTKGASV